MWFIFWIWFFSQIWTTGEDHSIADVINKEYKTIFSNYDAWYFDCGYAGWVTDGSNWCSPYKGINNCNNIPKNEINFVAKKYNFWLLKKRAVWWLCVLYCIVQVALTPTQFHLKHFILYTAFRNFNLFTSKSENQKKNNFCLILYMFLS